MKKAITTMIIIILIGILGYAFVSIYYVRYMYSDARIDLDDFYGVEAEDDYPIVLQDALSEYHAKMIDGTVYMDLSSVKSLLNDRFYYGEADGQLLYCLPDTRIETNVGENTWENSAMESTKELYVPAVLDGDVLYVALDYVKKFTNFSYEAYEEPNRIVMYTQWGDQEIAALTKGSQLRESGGVKSEIVTDVKVGDQVIVLEPMDKWSKVMTMDGYLGYIENRMLTEAETVSQTPVTDYTEPEFTHLSYSGKINMAWIQIASASGNDTIESALQTTKSVNVVAPTWLSITGDNGAVENRATQEAVDAIHAAGAQVSAVLDNFSSGTVYQDFLATEEGRSAVISSAVGTALSYGIDGINVDIESLSEDRGEDYIEFIRELSIECRKHNIYLSVDNYVPYNFNDHYHIDEQGVFVDYVVIMGYDEHYAGSQEPGSVASLEYVTNGIDEALQSVPADRLVNGIPFFTRIWKTDITGTTSTAYGMAQAKEYMANHNMTPEWDGYVGQYYAEVTEDEARYQIWVEDAESIRVKLEVMQEKQIAGVAEWSLGLETEDVWDVIEEYMNQ